MNGLTNEEVIINRKKYGSNIISKKKQDSFFKLLLETFSDPIIKILLIALGIKIIFLIRDLEIYETIGIVIAILVASLISSISEYGSMKAFNKLTSVTENINVKIKRNGDIKLYPIGDIVVGDLILVSPGDKIPCDGVVVSGNVSLDESMMNGESGEVYKSIDENVYMSTVVYDGEAYIRATSVGDNTFYGKMAIELQDNESESPLKIRLSKLANNISKLGYISSICVMFTYMFYMIFINNNFDMQLVKNTLFNGRLMFEYILNALTLCVTIIVVSVPDG